MFALALALVLLSTDQVAACVAPIRAAYAEAAAANTGEPSRLSMGERLRRLGALDQAGREALQKVKLRDLSPDDAKQARDAIWAEINAHDRENQRALRALLPAAGWFSVAEVGRDGLHASFLIAQHAKDDPELMRLALARLRPLVGSGGISGYEWAEMFDRAALDLDGRPQRYGTQVSCQHGEPWKLRPLEDLARVDERRASLGIKETEAEYMAQFEGVCPR